MSVAIKDPAIGHNQGPQDDGEALRERLAEQHAALKRRAGDLVAAEARMPEIADDASAGKAGDFIKQLAAAAKAADSARVAEKEPFLAGGRTVDGWFAKLKEPLDQVKRRVETKLSAYLRAKADRERREREEQARIAAEEAKRKEAEALAAASLPVSQAFGDAKVDQAIQAQADAMEAAKAAEAKPADMARTRGDMGAVATLRQEWTFDGLDRDQIDLEALRPHLPIDGIEKAVRAYIKSGGRSIRGARIFQNSTAVVR